MSESLYRKYRPANFSQVIGQDNIVKHLKSSIESGTLSHAYLLTGGRGVGKTTIARIIAKELGSSAEDIIELDAASNRGIDDARALREQVLAKPFTSKYKVYILDEAHMLTKEASNALLKTFEEPPNYVKFILCTTNPEKILPTIRSRCQILKLDDPTKENVVSLLSTINTAENLKISERLIDVIASQNTESYRDAIVEMERVARSANTEDQTLEELGRSDRSFKLNIELLRNILRKDIKSAMLSLEDIKSIKQDQSNVYKEITHIMRDMLIIKASAPGSIIPLYTSKSESHIIISDLLAENKDKVNSDSLRKLLECSKYFNYNLDGYLAMDITIITMCD